MGTMNRMRMMRVCSLGRLKFSRCIAISYRLTGRLRITKMVATKKACARQLASFRLVSPTGMSSVAAGLEQHANVGAARSMS